MSADSSDRPLFDLSLKEFIELFYATVSARLYNGIRYGASEDRLPYRSLGAYLAAGPERIEQLLRLPMLGRKSVHEFDALATRVATESCCDAVQTEAADGASQADSGEISAIFDIPLDVFLAQQPMVSPRLIRAVRAGIAGDDCPFSTVSAYLQAGAKRLSTLCKLPNLGATSAQEFEALVQDALRNGTIVPPSRLALNASGFPDLESLINEVFGALDERQTKLLLDRVESAATLDVTARHLGVTRERVRQIERKAIDELVVRFGQSFLQALAAIDAQCHQRGMRELTLHTFSELAGSDVLTCGLYFKFLKKFGIDDAETFVLSERIHLYRPAEFAPRDTWDERVDQALINACWPLVYGDFVGQVQDVPRSHVERSLCARYQARIVDDTFIEQPRLNVQKMCLQVLASTRTPMHLTEIRAGVFRHFGVDLNLHHVTGTVGGHDAITICAPGTYVRYVDLPYSYECIEDVRAHMQAELEARQVFLNSKLLFERLFADALASYPDGFNHYLLLGFAQDDTRFTVKRGNMIGLAGFDLAKTYISLEEEVRNIVLEHGPISINDIMTHMTATRRLCNDASVKLSLANSPELIQVGRRTYDSLHRFFADREEYDALVLALRIALLAGTKSVYALADDMAALGLPKASTEVIGSILAADDDVSEANGMFRLTVQDPPLQRYHEIALASVADGGIERLRQEADAALGSDVAARFIRFDRRFRAKPARRADTIGSALHAILADFDC
jgi:hypothetical protein